MNHHPTIKRIVLGAVILAAVILTAMAVPSLFFFGTLAFLMVIPACWIVGNMALDWWYDKDQTR